MPLIFKLFHMFWLTFDCVFEMPPPCFSFARNHYCILRLLLHYIAGHYYHNRIFSKDQVRIHSWPYIKIFHKLALIGLEREKCSNSHCCVQNLICIFSIKSNLFWFFIISNHLTLIYPKESMGSKGVQVDPSGLFRQMDRHPLREICDKFQILSLNVWEPKSTKKYFLKCCFIQFMNWRPRSISQTRFLLPKAG